MGGKEGKVGRREGGEEREGEREGLPQGRGPGRHQGRTHVKPREPNGYKHAGTSGSGWEAASQRTRIESYA